MYVCVSCCRNTGWGKANSQNPALTISKKVTLRHQIRQNNSMIHLFSSHFGFDGILVIGADYREIQTTDGHFSREISDANHNPINE